MSRERVALRRQAALKPDRFRHAGRRLAALVGVTVAVMMAGILPASANTAPSGYTTLLWAGSGSTVTAPLPAPYAGTATYTAGPGQTVIRNQSADTVTSYPSNPSAYQYCLNGYNYRADCGVTYTQTITFSTPVTNPALSIGLGGGGWTNGTDCAEYWPTAHVTAVNGVAPSGNVTPTSAVDSPMTWDGSSLVIPKQATPTCAAVGGGPEYFIVSGTITSVTLSYTVAAQVVHYTSGQIGYSAIGGMAIKVLVPPVNADLAVVKTASMSAGQVGQQVDWTMVVTNNGPDTEPSWTLTDAIPAGFTGASTSTPGCSISGGMLTCSGTNLASGATATIHLSGAVGTAGTVSNTANVTGTATDPNPANNTSTATVTVMDVPMVDWHVAAAGVAPAGLGAAALMALRRQRRHKAAA